MSHTSYIEKQSKWNEIYYSTLLGATVTKVECEADEDYEVWTKLTFEKDGQTFEVEISQDEEGNGPGFLFGLIAPSDEDNPFIQSAD